MHPGIAKGDIVIIDKQGFGNGDRSPIPGDLVVFRNRNMHGSMWLKRLVGGPGDQIDLHAGVLRINGTAISSADDRTCDENYCRVREQIGRSSYIATYLQPASLPSNEGTWLTGNSWFVLGDNRENSFDSRHFGPVATEDLRGRVVLVLDRAAVPAISHLIASWLLIAP